MPFLLGQGPSGQPVVLACTIDGKLIIDGGGAAAGGATEAKQDVQIAQLVDLIASSQGVEFAVEDVEAAIVALGGAKTLADLYAELTGLNTKAAADALLQANIDANISLSALSLQAIDANTDGVETILGAIRDRLPAALVGGRLAIALDGETTTAATLPISGALIKSGRGNAMQLEFRNTSGASVFMQIHNKIAAPLAGDRPAWFAIASTNNNAIANLQLGHTSLGVPCSSGIWLVASSSADTYTPIGSSAIGYNIVWQ